MQSHALFGSLNEFYVLNQPQNYARKVYFGGRAGLESKNQHQMKSMESEGRVFVEGHLNLKGGQGWREAELTARVAAGRTAITHLGAPDMHFSAQARSARTPRRRRSHGPGGGIAGVGA